MLRKSPAMQCTTTPVPHTPSFWRSPTTSSFWPELVEGQNLRRCLFFCLSFRSASGVPGERSSLAGVEQRRNLLLPLQLSVFLFVVVCFALVILSGVWCLAPNAVEGPRCIGRCHSRPHLSPKKHLMSLSFGGSVGLKPHEGGSIKSTGFSPGHLSLLLLLR